MDFINFSKKVSKLKNLPLPGPASHFKMAPLARQQLLETALLSELPLRKAGVMALFFPGSAGDTRFLLILRKTYEGIHSNQIGFPGGKMEMEDMDLLDTALRETREEVGVPPEDVEVIRALSELYIPPSNFQVVPYLGLYPKPRPFRIQESEVAALIQVPLTAFLDSENQTTTRLSTSYAKRIEVPAFHLEGHLVWGATAMMLSEIRDLFRKVL